MLTLIKNSLAKTSLYFAFLCTAGIAFLSLVRLPQGGLQVNASDKLLHGIAYFFLAIFWLIAMAQPKCRYTHSWWVLGGCLIYGIVIEVLQGALTSYRTASYLDILANSGGIAVAFFVFLVLRKKNLLIPS